MINDPKSEKDDVLKPQVIDLQAEDVTVSTEEPRAGVEETVAEADEAKVESAGTEADASSPEEAAGESDRAGEAAEETASEEPPPPPKHKSRGSLIWIVAALLLGAVGGGWLYRDVISSYLPTNEMTAMRGHLDALEASNKTLAEQIAGLGQSVDKAAQAAAGAESAVKETATGLASANSRIDGFDARIAAAEESLKAARTDLAELRNAVSQVGTGTGTGTVDSAALAAIGQRLDALEKDVASLKSSGGGGDQAKLTAALSQSLSDLKAKIASGAAYQAEYDRIARMVPAAPGLDVLASHAAEGLPTAKGLADELTAIIPTLPRPEEPPPPTEESYWDSFVGLVSGIITIRDIGDTDWQQLAQRCVGLAEAGDLTQAISLIDGAEGTKPSALLQWHDRAAARLRLETALGQVSEAVVRQITALGGAQ